jgi:hypothetical protein
MSFPGRMRPIWILCSPSATTPRTKSVLFGLASRSRPIRGVRDPAAAQGTQTQIAAAFRDALLVLQRRIELFANLSVRSLDRISLKKRLDDIGKRDAP